MQWWIEEGCNDGWTSVSANDDVAWNDALPTTDYDIYNLFPSGGYTYPGAPSNTNCTNSNCGPPTCDSTNNDCVQGIDDPDIDINIADALDERIYGMACPDGNGTGSDGNCKLNGGTPNSGICTSPSNAASANLWEGANSVADILALKNDPRLVTVPITYFGSLYPNSEAFPPTITVPITGFAEFYITGWWGDPCSPENPNHWYPSSADQSGSTSTCSPRRT